MMLNLSGLPTIDPLLLLGTDPLPPPAGPVRLSLMEQQQRERPAMLAECFARIGYRYDMERLPDVPFAADLALNVLPDLLVMEGRLHGSRNRRTAAMVQEGGDDAVLLINLRGPHLIEQFGQEALLGDGDAVLVSGADPSCFTHKPPGQVLGLRLPKARLMGRLAAAEHTYMRPVPARSAALNLLRNYVGLCWGSDVAADKTLAGLVSSQIVDLMAVALGPTRDAAEQSRSGGLRAARLLLVKQEIARRLSDPGLSLLQMAAHFHCAPRAVQRLFEADGTSFTQHVLEERLALAHARLADARLSMLKISGLALDCGFNDVSYFNRSFRRRFGLAPSDVRGLRG
jgi:AraC-like DNA-binding protein